MFNKKIKELENPKLEIKPEGWVDTLILEGGSWRCGKAYNGIEIRLSDQRGGGVMTLEDALRIKKFIEDHFRFVLEEEELENNKYIDCDKCGARILKEKAIKGKDEIREKWKDVNILAYGGIRPKEKYIHTPYYCIHCKKK